DTCTGAWTRSWIPPCSSELRGRAAILPALSPAGARAEPAGIPCGRRELRADARGPGPSPNSRRIHARVPQSLDLDLPARRSGALLHRERPRLPGPAGGQLGRDGPVSGAGDPGAARDGPARLERDG